jgi:hypothetical protein
MLVPWPLYMPSDSHNPPVAHGSLGQEPVYHGVTPEAAVYGYCDASSEPLHRRGLAVLSGPPALNPGMAEKAL